VRFSPSPGNAPDPPEGRKRLRKKGKRLAKVPLRRDGAYEDRENRQPAKARGSALSIFRTIFLCEKYHEIHSISDFSANGKNRTNFRRKDFWGPKIGFFSRISKMKNLKKPALFELFREIFTLFSAKKLKKNWNIQESGVSWIACAGWNHQFATAAGGLLPSRTHPAACAPIS